jgi:hypothetical protein
MFKKYRRVVPGLMLAAGLSIATPACAQSRYYESRRADTREFERRAYDVGFRDGVAAAEKDLQRHRPYSIERHDNWRDADDGYHRGWGDRELYRRVFRDAFRKGYSEAFSRERAYRERDFRR